MTEFQQRVNTETQEPIIPKNARTLLSQLVSHNLISRIGVVHEVAIDRLASYWLISV